MKIWYEVKRMAAEMLKKVIATENEAAENEKNAASEPGERSCLSRTGVILEIEEREYRRRINRRSELWREVFLSNRLILSFSFWSP